jgi:predicted metal-binding membrane protein
MNIWWIAAITIYVAVEKLVPGGKTLSVIMAGCLLLAGVALLLKSTVLQA